MIRRWERVLGRPAPAPTVPGRNGRPRLAPRFVEWMMGLDDGWVTGHGLRPAQELKMLGNGVVPQQAALALRMLLGLPAAGVDGGGALLPTPDTGHSPNGHGRRGGKAGNGHQSGASLDAVAAALLPTPQARDYRDASLPPPHGLQQSNLPDVVRVIADA